MWTGRVLSALVTCFLLFDCITKIARVRAAVEGMAQLGYPNGVLVPIGVTLLICTILYAIPRTSVLGAVLVTGYLGGAVATNVRAGLPMAAYGLAPVYVGVLAWLGLYLRSNQIRRILPVVQERF
ncbi:MAG: DoxX family protein [Candidatus Korobacteraceae bacterium]